MKKYQIIIGVVLVLLLIPLKPSEEKIKMEYYNYVDLEIISSKKPQNTHLWFETTAGGLYLVDSADNTKIYYSQDKGENWSQIDIDPSNSSGDNKSRDHDIQAAWHDRTNKIIHFVDCDNDGAQTDFDYWTLDYSASESSPTTTEEETAFDPPQCDELYVYDICSDGDDIILLTADSDNDLFNFDLTPAAAWIATRNGSGFGGSSYIVHNGAGSLFAVVDAGADVEMLLFDDGTLDLTGSALTGYQVPTSKNLRGVSYDGSNVLYTILKKTADGKNYLVSFTISTATWTVLGEHDIALMMDRNTVSGVLEKGFHTSSYEVYQIQDNNTQLNLIASPDTDAVIIAITDNFFMNDDGDMWEYQDELAKYRSIEIIHDIMEMPKAMVTVPKADVYIDQDLVFKCIDKYTSAGSTSDEIIFEGKISTWNETAQEYAIFLESLAAPDLNSKPSGTYSGRSDEIISSLIAEMNYITEGTLSVGSAMGDIIFGGQ